MKALTPDILEQLRSLGTCLAANAIEKFKVRPRNEGFTDSSVRCMFPTHPAIIGYAVTGRIRSDVFPVAEVMPEFLDRTDWWDHVLSIQGPKIVVLQDMDPHLGIHPPGHGAFWGVVHANIHLRLGCVGAITNGAVRYVDRIEHSGFQVFAGRVSVSHGFVHFVDFGNQAQVAGLTISSADLLLADQHGALLIPQEIAADIPAVAQEIERKKQRIVHFCRSSAFSLEELRKMVKEDNGG
jgi:4-hydroxy-4-methyl-2-oxoglutarate aldolase